MPGFITHLCLGDKAINFIDDKAIQSVILEYRNVYNLGLEGPDIFFYHIPSYLFYPHNIGNVMHSNSTMLFFDALINSRNSFENSSDRNICDSYILGFLGHFTLDVWCHPYIYWKSNHFDNIKTHSSKYDFGKHVTLETDIDHVILNSYYALKPTDFDYAAAISISKYQKNVIAKLISNSINNTYSDYHLSPSTVIGAINAITRLNRAMNDPYGKKKATVNKIERLLFKCDFISSMIPSNTIISYSDPCNEQHAQWFNPWDTDAVNEASFFDLVSSACKDYLIKISAYTKSIYSDIEDEIQETSSLLHYRNEFLSLLGDLSYLNGLPIP